MTLYQERRQTIGVSLIVERGTAQREREGPRKSQGRRRWRTDERMYDKVRAL